MQVALHLLYYCIYSSSIFVAQNKSQYYKSFSLDYLGSDHIKYFEWIVDTNMTLQLIEILDTIKRLWVWSMDTFIEIEDDLYNMVSDWFL